MCALRLLPGISPSGRVQPATTVAVRQHIPQPWIRSVVQTGIQEEGRAAAARRLQSSAAGGSDRFSKLEWRAAGLGYTDERATQRCPLSIPVRPDFQRT